MLISLLTALASLAPSAQAGATTAPAGPARPDGARVLGIYNAGYRADANGDGVQDSLEVARYYQGKRAVPAKNLLGLPIDVKRRRYYSKEWDKFFQEVIVPLNEKLLVLGRGNIDYFAICKGVPVYVNSLPIRRDGKAGWACLDTTIMAPTFYLSRRYKERFQSKNIYGAVRLPNPYLERNPTFAPPDRGRFRKMRSKLYGGQMYLPCRIDGIDPGRAKELIDGALYAERYLHPDKDAYNGNIYIDTRYRRYDPAKLPASKVVTSGSYNKYAQADENMAYAATFARASGLPVRWENTARSANIGSMTAQYDDGSSATEAPRALFFAGWYGSGSGRHWQWLPGSVRCDLHSMSLAGYPSGSAGASAQIAGASAVCGTVSEPYLSGVYSGSPMFMHIHPIIGVLAPAASPKV